jgi:hypothetical protein
VASEDRVPTYGPLRNFREIMNDALAALDSEFSPLDTAEERSSIVRRSYFSPRF